MFIHPHTTSGSLPPAGKSALEQATLRLGPQMLCVWLTAVLIAIFWLPMDAYAADLGKRRFSFDTTPQGGDLAESVSQLPVLVRLHSGNFDFTQAAADGSDLRFFAADGKTPLKFHLESYDATNELAAVWVQLPKLLANSTADAFFVQWGDPKAPGSGDPRSTYDASQAFVLHFSTDGVVRDASGHLPDPPQSDARPVAAGAIGAAAAFDGGARLLIAATPALAIRAADGFTFSTWVRPAEQGDGELLSLGPAATGIVIRLEAGVLVVRVGTATFKANVPLKPGIWQHIAVTVAGGQGSIQVDGIETGKGPLALSDTSGDVAIGTGFRGELDEVSLSVVARSPAYVKALAMTQAAESLMLGLATEESEEGGTSYFTILLGAVTIDGWVVIGILMIMFVISIWVMIAKSISLSSVKKSNALFLELFRTQTAALLDPSNPLVRQLTENTALNDSSTYALYKAAMVEVNVRLERLKSRGGAVVLSAAMLESVRAALDANQVKLNQRFNSGIVLLTIAISGGPFLGLLGTVVGVMITFAAIAASGDVNVNSIAPGIAAALVATVAGLAVAIPALFGYNWLAIQIKNVSTDTQVFSDELLTLTAERYSE